MKRMIAILVAAMFVVGIANAQTVCLDTSKTAMTFNVSNTNWNSEGDTSLGVSVFSLDKVSNFGKFINASTFDDNYEVNVGVTKHIDSDVYGYLGLGFVSPTDHECPLVGTVVYGAVWDTQYHNLVVNFSEDTNAGHTLGIGTKF